MAKAHVNRVNMSEAEFEQRLNETHFLGHAAGLEAAVARLRSVASNLFLTNDEDGARAMRNIANDLDVDARKLRDQWGPKTIGSTR